jgi:hypothetical protein
MSILSSLPMADSKSYATVMHAHAKEGNTDGVQELVRSSNVARYSVGFSFT